MSAHLQAREQRHFWPQPQVKEPPHLQPPQPPAAARQPRERVKLGRVAAMVRLLGKRRQQPVVDFYLLQIWQRAQALERRRQAPARNARAAVADGQAPQAWCDSKVQAGDEQAGLGY